MKILRRWIERTLGAKKIAPSPPRRTRLNLEQLEEREVPASISYATLFGGNVYASAVNSSGDVYITGAGFVAELNPTGTAVLYDTSIGGGRGTGIALDSAGDAYVIGGGDTNVPTTPNAIASSESGNEDFVAELNPTGSIVYATYLPGTIGNSLAKTLGNAGAIAVDGSGDIYVAGAAGAGLPATAGAFQAAPASGSFNAFFAKIDPALSGSASLLYASYLGGNAGIWGDAATGIALDGSGNAYLTGYTTSTNFPTTSGAFQTTYGGGTDDAFVAKFNPALSGAASLVYSTYLGGSGAEGYVSDGTALFDARNDGGIAVDSAGNAYVTGSTASSNFPTTTGAFQVKSGFSGNGTDAGSASDAFVTKLNATGTGLVYSTYIGGGGSTRSGATSIAIDSNGDAYLTGWTNSTAFPTKNPVQSTDPGNNASTYGAFVTVLSPSGSSLLFSSYVGGNPTVSGRVEGMSIGLDPEGDVYVGGITESYSGFPTTPGAYQTTGGSGFALEITALVGPSFTITGPATVTAGATGAYTLTTLNPNGTVDTAYSGTVQITSSDPHAVLPGDVTITDGVGAFNVTLETAGTQSVAAADVSNSGINGADAGIAVTPAAASQIVYIQSPTSSVAGQTLGSVEAAIEDAYGNVETGDNSDQIAVSVNSGPSTQLGGTAVETVQAGVAVFSNLLLDTSGSYTLAALANLAGGVVLGPAVSSGFTVASPVSISLGTITYSSKTGLYSETVTLTNTTGATLTGPLSLELTNLPSGVVLTDSTGTTNGNPYVRFLASGKTLKKNADVSVTLTFTAPSLSDIDFGTEVVVGL